MSENTNAGGGEAMNDAEAAFAAYRRECRETIEVFKAGFDAALSAQSTGSGGVAAEPVAWAKDAEALISASRELFGYASYAEIVNGISVNRSQIRKWCDKTIEAIHALENSLDAAARLAPAAPRKGPSEEDIAKKAAAVVQDVTEWDDRTSPEDWPEALLITGKELQQLLETFAAALLTPADRGETQAVGDGLPWLDQPLPEDVDLGGCIFRKGVRIGVLVDAARRYYRVAKGSAQPIGRRERDQG